MTIKCTDVLGHPKTIDALGTVEIEAAGEFTGAVAWIKHHYPAGDARVDLAYGERCNAAVTHLEVS